MRKSNNPVGRPKKKFDFSPQEKQKILNLVAANCSISGLKRYLELSSDNTWYNNLLKDEEFLELLAEGKELKNTIIQMKQMELAMQGNVPMLIHLGKTELGQTEKTEIKANLSHDFNLNQADEDIINEFIRKHKEQPE